MLKKKKKEQRELRPSFKWLQQTKLKIWMKMRIKMHKHMEKYL